MPCFLNINQRGVEQFNRFIQTFIKPRQIRQIGNLRAQTISEGLIALRECIGRLRCALQQGCGVRQSTVLV